MRRNAPPGVKPAYPRYRVRFKTSETVQKIFKAETNVATAYPGVIIRNRPKADRALAAMHKFDAWLEIQAGPDGEWRRI